jgi:serine/threonine-protein kinase
MRTVVYGPRGAEQWGLQHGSAVHIIEQCLRGLGALHHMGIVHCDIKPENLMIDSQGCVRLIDFGSAYELSSPPEEHAWTPRYAPPEVLEGGEWTKKADFASAGYVLVELLSGQSDVLIKLPGEKSPSIDLAMRSQSVRLLDQKTREKLAEVKRQLPGQLANLIPRPRSPRLIPICNNLFHPNPDKRFGSAENAIFDVDGTRRFLNQLDDANLAARWASDLRLWVEGVKRWFARARSVE